MFEHLGSAAPSARVGATGPAGAPGRDGVLDEGFGEDPDADEEVLDRLAAMAPGAQLADVVERFLSPLLGPAPAGNSPSDSGDLGEGECFRLFGPGGEGALVERVLDVDDDLGGRGGVLHRARDVRGDVERGAVRHGLLESPPGVFERVRRGRPLHRRAPRGTAHLHRVGADPAGAGRAHLAQCEPR